MRTLHRWTAEEREIIRLDYQGNNESAQRIADRLGVTLLAVKGQIQQLGCGKITDHQQWTPKQDEMLRELIPSIPVRQIAKKMHRLGVLRYCPGQAHWCP